MKPLEFQRFAKLLSLFLILSSSALFANKDDGELAKLKYAFRDFRLRESFEPDRYLDFSQLLYGKDPGKGLVTLPEIKKYTLLEAKISPFKEALTKAEASIATLSMKEKLVVIDSFHRDLAKRMSHLESQRDWAEFSFLYRLMKQSEVGETVDGEFAPNGEDGSRHDLHFSGKFTGRSFPWGQLALETGIDSTQYSQTTLDDRNKVVLYAELTDTFNLNYRVFDKVEYALRTDFNIFSPPGESTGLGYYAITPGATLDFNPSWLAGTFLKADYSSLSFDWELRKYRDTLRSDDANRISLGWNAGWLQEYNRFKGQTQMAITLLNSSSSDDNIKYSELAIGADYLYKHKVVPYALRPALRFANRFGFDYLGQSRDDSYFELALSGMRYFSDEQIALSLDISHLSNSSGVDLFDYDDDRISLSLICNW
ncbi:MAG: hypothetical protein HQL32_13625 [Planctomycetes bacterium]|nr:hypothetical protein [Planctomycetota bacterium]